MASKAPGAKLESFWAIVPTLHGVVKDFRFSRVLRNKYPPAEPGVLRLLPPQRGPTAIEKSQSRTTPALLATFGALGFPSVELHTPGTVKLWESPGKAGDLPKENYPDTGGGYTVTSFYCWMRLILYCHQWNPGGVCLCRRASSSTRYVPSPSH
jgi:hypothetical protein